MWVDSMTHIESYGDSMDVTTDINGNTINFLNDGNVLLEFEWTNGRQLKALYFVDGETGERVCFAYNTYDENGMRTSKTYDGVTTYYNYQGDKLLSQYNQEEDGSIDEVIFFLYDSDDNIIGMN